MIPNNFPFTDALVFILHRFGLDTLVTASFLIDTHSVLLEYKAASLVHRLYFHLQRSSTRLHSGLSPSLTYICYFCFKTINTLTYGWYSNFLAGQHTHCPIMAILVQPCHVYFPRTINLTNSRSVLKLKSFNLNPGTFQIHSSSRSIASSKADFLQSASWCSRFQFTVFSLYCKVIH